MQLRSEAQHYFCASERGAEHSRITDRLPCLTRLHSLYRYGLHWLDSLHWLHSTCCCHKLRRRLMNNMTAIQIVVQLRSQAEGDTLEDYRRNANEQHANHCEPYAIQLLTHEMIALLCSVHRVLLLTHFLPIHLLTFLLHVAWRTVLFQEIQKIVPCCQDHHTEYRATSAQQIATAEAAGEVFVTSLCSEISASWDEQAQRQLTQVGSECVVCG